MKELLGSQSSLLVAIPLVYLSLKAFGVIGSAEKYYDDEEIARLDVDKFQNSNGSLESKEEKEILKRRKKVTLIPDSEPHPDIPGRQVGRVVWKIAEGDDSVWDDLFDRETNANSADIPYREFHKERAEMKNKQRLAKIFMQADSKDLKERALNRAFAGSLFYSSIQTTQEGNMTFWPGDYGGPMFLLPGFVIACYVTGVEIGETRKRAMIKYLVKHQQGDGGWGLHIECKSTMFGTVLNYVCLRLLGAGMTSHAVTRARQFIHIHGGATKIPPWGKFWLAILGVYDYSGINAVPPELFLLPRWLPFHPGRLWCHCRMVYLPMSAMYGMKFHYSLAEKDPLILGIRSEIFVDRYENINWSAERESIAPIDVYSPQSQVMTFAHSLLEWTLENKYLRRLFSFPLTLLRRRAINFMLDYCAAEDGHTNYVDIGPVNKAMNMICAFVRHGPDSPKFKSHIPRLHDYLWFAEDGLKMKGYNGSHHWDTSFGCIGFSEVILGLREKNMDDPIVFEGMMELTQSLVGSYRFFDANQISDNPKDRKTWHRAITKGGWGFSTQDNVWPVSDCTSEGLKAIFSVHELNILSSEDMLNEARLGDAIDVIMSMYNKSNAEGDRGWASYEINRGYKWYEKLNPAQVFGDIMIDYCYVECTSACIQAILQFAHAYPDNSRNYKTLPAAVNGIDFILRQQREDGSWYGSWAVCFTYGHWFGCSALSKFLNNIDVFRRYCGKEDLRRIEGFKISAKLALAKALKFITDRQLEDGGWGEGVEACANKVYTPNEDGSQVVQTAWALLGLNQIVKGIILNKQQDDLLKSASRAAARFLFSRQEASGDWPQEALVGIFNKSAGITYTAYRNVFPIWALAEYSRIED